MTRSLVTLIAATTAAVSLGAAVHAAPAPIAAQNILRASDTAQPQLIFGTDGVDQGALLEKAQWLYGGRNYCFYDSGWRGPGYYYCGYAFRRGFGWGGPLGWHGWGRTFGGGYHGGYRGGYHGDGGGHFHGGGNHGGGGHGGESHGGGGHGGGDHGGDHHH